MSEENSLLQCYAETGSEEAFGQLVSRHVDLVYSVALRLVGGDAHMASDVVQTVFIDLSTKAKALPRGVVLAGWLCRHAFFVASSLVRTERRRRMREREAAQMNASNDVSEPDWEKLNAVLDVALQGLGSIDRDAIVLRYFENRDLKVVGAALGMNEDTAQKRISRALEKLRVAISKRGVALTVAGLGTALASNSVVAAPVGMAASVTTFTFGGAGAGSPPTIGWIKLLAGLKAKSVIFPAAAVVLGGVSVAWLLLQEPVRITSVKETEDIGKPVAVVRAETQPRDGLNGRFGLHWSQIESTDYPRYIANLRAIGCPEQTIRDIILADLNQAYQSRAEKIWLSQKREYWQKSIANGPNRGELKQLKELGREKSRVLQDLLGVPMSEQEIVDLVFGQIPRAELSVRFLPEEKRRAASEALLAGGLEEGAGETPNSDGREVFDQKLKLLAEVLSPQELEEYRLHNSPRAQWLRTNVQYLNCTPEEFKALLDMREEALGPDAKDQLSVSRGTELEQARKVLGEERGKEYERLTDYGYLNGRRAAERAGLPDDIAEGVGQIVYEARIAVDQLAEDKDSPVEDRKAKVESLKLRAENRLNAIVVGAPTAGILRSMRSTLDNAAQLIRP
jgi:RNA polymerase sigma factor (sigma-70 family)